MALRQQRYRCASCGHRWEQLIWDGGRPEAKCLSCGRTTAVPIFGDALDAQPGADGLCWSDGWRGETKTNEEVKIMVNNVKKHQSAVDAIGVTKGKEGGT